MKTISSVVEWCRYFFRLFRDQKYMGWFTPNYDLNEDESGELENMSAKLKETLGELKCEEAIMKEKERFGRVRMIMMKSLIVEYGEDVARRAQGRVNKRMKEGYLNQQTRKNNSTKNNLFVRNVVVFTQIM